MADEAKRDAKLSLKFDTADAVKGMKDLDREGKKVSDTVKQIGDTAKAAAKDIGGLSEAIKRTEGRYGDSLKEWEGPRLGTRAYNRISRQYGIDEGRRQDERRGYDALGFETQAMTAARNVQGPQAAGLMGMAVRALVSAGAIAAIAKQVTDSYGRLADIEGNISTTRAQKDRASLAEFDLVGIRRWFIDKYEQFSGINELRRQAAEETARGNVMRPGHWANESMRLDYASQANIARREDFALMGARVSGSGVLNQYDRSTVAGARMHQEELQRLSGYDASADAQRRAQAARASVGDAESQLAAIERAREQATHRQQGARQRYYQLGAQGGAVRNPETDRALGEWNAANQDVAALNDLRIQQIQRVRDLTVNASQAEAQARQRNIDLMRTELSIAEARTNNLIGAAERFGAMNPLQQSLAASALRAVRDRGVRGVTPEVLSLASSLDPDFVRMAQRNRAESEPMFQQLRREGFLDTGAQGTIAQNQAAAEQLRQQIREQTLESQQLLAEEVSGALGSTFERILRTFNDRMSALENQFSQQQQNQFNQQ